MSAAAQLAGADSCGREVRMATQPLPVRRASTTRVEIHCAFCGYGGVVNRLPDRCPMCGLHAWEVCDDVTSGARRARGGEQDAGRVAAAG